jgi:glycosyltransferase involved in cell wall biosynthesis
MSRGEGPLWVTDWSDSEDADFHWAWERAGIEPRVLRALPLGPTVGLGRHRLRSYPTYASLAVRGLRQAGEGALVAWQPLAGAVAGLVRRERRPPVVSLGAHLYFSEKPTLARRLAIKGLARNDRLIFFTHYGMDIARRHGIPSERLLRLPLGVRPRREEPRKPGEYILAAGRDSRDWSTLAQAARGLDAEVIVMGPVSLPDSGLLRLAPQVSGDPFFELLEHSCALVLPLDTDRPMGHLSMLAAMSVGRAIVVTHHPGVEDYVSEETGIVVPPKDPDALREALRRVSDPAVAHALGRAALQAARTKYSLETFVKRVDDEARALSGR